MINPGYLSDEFHDSIDKTEIIELTEPSKCSVFSRKLGNFLEPFTLWNSSLKTIEKKCGCAVSSYFQFIAWLFKINLCMLIFLLVILVIPFQIFKPSSFDKLVIDLNNQHEYDKFTLAMNCSEKARIKQEPISIKLIFDILNGQGPLENSPMFIGYYFNISNFNISSQIFTKAVYNTPVFYSFVFWLCVLSSFIVMIYSSGKNYKLYKIDEDDFSGKFGLCLLTGFDYGVTKKKRLIDMKSDLTKKLKFQYNQIEEFNKKSRLSKKSPFLIFLPRLIVNSVFIAFLILIYFAIAEASDVPIKLAKNEFVKSNPFLQMAKDYVPSVTIAMINVVFHIINTKVVTFENYTKTIAVEVCLLRLILVQGISLLIFMVTLLDQTSQSNISDKICVQTDVIKCWENLIGQQFYRYSLLLFITSVFVRPLIQLLRSLIYKRFTKKSDSNQETKISKFVEFIGAAEFDLSEEGFILINSQCACWMGLWFCPFLVVIMVLKLFLLFYIRKSMFLRNLFKTRMETATVSGGQKFLLGMLLKSLAFVMLPVGYILSNKSPSRGCSPFRIYDYPDQGYSFISFLVEYIVSLSDIIAKIWHFITSVEVILAFLGIIIIITYIKYAQAKAVSKSIEAIRTEIINEENNLLFYFKQIMNATEINKKSQILLQLH